MADSALIPTGAGGSYGAAASDELPKDRARRPVRPVSSELGINLTMHRENAIEHLDFFVKAAADPPRRSVGRAFASVAGLPAKLD